MTQEQKGSQKKSTKKPKKVRIYSHKSTKRVNNPPTDLLSTHTEPIPTQSTKYRHDPYLDPFLSWASKQEHQEVEVHNTSLHIHEKIDPQRIISALLKPDPTPKQPSFFEDKDNVLPLDKAVHESLPFKLGDERRIAVKVIDHRGIESLMVKNIK